MGNLSQLFYLIKIFSFLTSFQSGEAQTGLKIQQHSFLWKVLSTISFSFSNFHPMFLSIELSSPIFSNMIFQRWPSNSLRLGEITSNIVIVFD